MNVAMFIEVNEHYFEMDFAEDYTWWDDSQSDSFESYTYENWWFDLIATELMEMFYSSNLAVW
jgi:hypothetical protein